MTGSKPHRLPPDLQRQIDAFHARNKWARRRERLKYRILIRSGLLCRLGFHHFAGWATAGPRATGPLPYARCSRCGRIL